MIILLIAIIIADAHLQANLVKSGEWINHRDSSLTALFYTVLLNLLLINITHELRIVLPLLLAIRWLIFDLFINIFRFGIGKFYYIGYTAWFDKQLRKLPYPYISQYLIKLLVLCLTSLAYIIWSYSF